MSDLVTDADDFEAGDEAIEYALAHRADAPLDELSDGKIRAELAMFEAVLKWEQSQQDPDITGRVTELKTALELEQFDALEHDRKGSRYLDQHDNLVVLDGALDENAAAITHYHYIIIPNSGEIARADEASETVPEDEDTQWLSVADLDAHIADGTLYPAHVVAENEEIQ